MNELIERQAAIDAIHNLYAIHGSEGSWIDQKDAFKALNSLPSAQPEPHEGEWERVSAQRYFMSASYFYRCSACGVNNVRNTNYCPNCGTKMKGEANE